MGVFSKWARKAGCYGCKVCGKADSAESPMLLCDHCCQGIHQNCFLLPGSRVLSLLTQVCRFYYKLSFGSNFGKYFSDSWPVIAGCLSSVTRRYCLLLLWRLSSSVCCNQNALQTSCGVDTTIKDPFGHPKCSRPTAWCRRSAIRACFRCSRNLYSECSKRRPCVKHS